MLNYLNLTLQIYQKSNFIDNFSYINLFIQIYVRYQESRVNINNNF